ncbi:VPLPA-CTERM sorting domain-containing protein [Actibacterium lipolyticum]|uniref:Ice-binding protein C-terminal domain-containing protein n=1 Tax=Actibacterium lipolyticum TaxID=1524263 RepID=A0A238JMP5_9RHOB|nr:VPLPA-CTERM sorting domain-containing protein [Actibacterium lipolyticum]SMX31467.1 hypothetical protein COL8621_00462 [Actibacterium lipolyticum]
MRNIFASFAVFCCLAVPASAVTVTEPPDLADGLSTASSIGTLDLGLNTITGEIRGECEDLGTGILCNSDAVDLGDTQDSLIFSIGPDELLTTVSVIGFGDHPEDATYYVAITDASLTTVLAVDYYDFNDGGSFYAGLGEGTYSVSIFGGTASEEDGFRLRYDLALTVAAVPLPATAPLLLGGLGLFAAARRRSRRKNA